MKINLTQEEYRELKELLLFIKDKCNLSGSRRLAMAKFDYIFNNRKQIRG